MLRRARLDAPGNLDHVMARGIEKRKMATTPTTAKALERAGSK